MSQTTRPAPRTEPEAPAINELNIYILVALGGLPALKPPRVPSQVLR
jgi:hypothetical protein